MSPAFSSTRQAAAFAALLLLLVLLPVLLGKPLLPPRDEIYSSLPWGAGAFPYLHDQIFEEKGDIDIAFMGSSRMWWALDVAQIQEQLSKKLGRPAVVRSLCWNSPGVDPFYFILDDLLKHRNVSMIVFADCVGGSGNTAHPRAPFWFRFAENEKDLNGLAPRQKLSFYTAAIVGAPRNLLGLLRGNLPPIPSDGISWGDAVLFTNIANPFQHLGALTVPMTLGRPFVNYIQKGVTQPGDARVYSDDTKTDFRFLEQPIWPLQGEFARKIGELAEADHVKLVYLHLPLLAEGRSNVLEEQTYWPRFFHDDVTMVGIPPAKLFAGLTGEEMTNLFYNFEHLNENGQRYFTPLIAPTLLRLYEDQAKH